MSRPGPDLLTPTQPRSRIEKLWALAVVLAIGAALAIIIFGIFRGLDWTDESWTISISGTQRVSDTEPWGFQFLVHPLHVLLDSNVIALRFLRLFLYVGLGLAAASVLLRIAAARGILITRYARVFVFALAQAGTVLAWSWPPRAFAYNELTAFLVQLVALLVALLVVEAARDSIPSLSTRTSIALWSIVGLAVGLLFFTKFSAFFMLFPIALVGTLIQARSRRVPTLITLVGGIAAAIGGPWALGLPLPTYTRSVVANLLDERIRAANVHSQDILVSYAHNLWITFVLLVLPALLMLIAGALVGGTWGENAWARGVTLRIGILLTVTLVAVTLDYVAGASDGAHKTGRVALVLLAAGAVLLLFASWSSRRQPENPDPWATTGPPVRWRVWLGFLLIATAPVMVSFGTNNPLTLHFGFGATVWATGFGVGVAALFQVLAASAQPSRRYWPLALGVVAAALCLLVAVAEARVPFRSASFLANNVAVTEPGPFAGLFVTKDENDLISWLGEQEDALDAAQTPTISLASAGALLAFNNSDFASSYIGAWWPASYWTIATSCEAEMPNDLIVLQTESAPAGSPDWNELAATLSRSCGLNFPDDFDAVASFDSANPQFDVTIWNLRTLRPSS